MEPGAQNAAPLSPVAEEGESIETGSPALPPPPPADRPNVIIAPPRPDGWSNNGGPLSPVTEVDESVLSPPASGRPSILSPTSGGGGGTGPASTLATHRLQASVGGGVAETTTAFKSEWDDRKSISTNSWKPPSLKKARAFRESLLFEKGRAPVCGCGSEGADAMGVGIGLYFRLVKYLGVFFLVAALISIPLMFISFEGGRLLPEEADPLRVSLISIANVPYGPNATISVSGSEYSAQTVSAVYMTIDFVYSVLFLFLIWFIARKIKTVTERIEQGQVTAEDYGILVQGLPPDVTEDEVVAHFDRLYNLRAHDWTFDSSCRRCYIGRKVVQRRRFKDEGVPPARMIFFFDPKEENLSVGRWLRKTPAPSVLAKAAASVAPETASSTTSGGIVEAGLNGSTVANAMQSAPTATSDAELPPKASPALAAKASFSSALSDDSEDEDDVAENKRKIREAKDAEIAAATAAAANAIRTLDGPLFVEVRPSLDDPSLIQVAKKKTRKLTAMDVQPVLETRHTGDEAYLGSWVSEVSLATANGALILRYQALASLFQEIRTTRAAIRKFSAGSVFMNDKKREKAEKKLAKLEEELRQADQKYAAQYNPDVVAAFVLFENEESLRRCLDDYRGSSGPFYACSPRYWHQPEPLRFRDGQHRLRVAKAPDPSSVLWENLEAPITSKCFRRSLVALAMILLLVLCFFVLMAAQGIAARFRSRVPNLSLCDDVLPSIALGIPLSGAGVPQTSVPNAVGLTANATACPSNLGPGYMQLAWVGLNGTTGQFISRQTTLVNSNPCLQECLTPATDLTCSWPTTTAGTNITFSTKTSVACYCLASLRQAMLDGQGIFAAARSLIADDNDFCEASAKDYLLVNALVLLASFVTVAVNILLPYVVTYLTDSERHKSLEDRDWSLAVKAFVFLFLNTAILTLLSNAALPASVANIQIGDAVLFGGQQTGFSTRWHASVGAGIVLTMLLNVFTPHILPLVQAFLWTCKRRVQCCAFYILAAGPGSHVTQSQLNQAWEPPPFLFPMRVASVANTIAVCLFYSTGHPILLVIAAASLFLSFFIDRLMLFRFYRRTPRYNNALPLFLRKLMPWVLLFHLLISIWTLSDPNVLWSPVFGLGSAVNVVQSGVSTIGNVIGGFTIDGVSSSNALLLSSRLSRENTLPMVVLTVLFVAVWVSLGVLDVFGGLIAQIFLCCSCCRGCCDCSWTRICGACCRCCVRYIPPTKEELEVERERRYNAEDDDEEAFASCIPRSCSNAAYSAPRLHNSRFTGPFATTLAHGEDYRLSRQEKRWGFRFWRDDSGQLLKIRLWTSAGPSFGTDETHLKGELMTSWEVMASTGSIASFAMAANPRYASSVVCINAAWQLAVDEAMRLQAEEEEKLRKEQEQAEALALDDVAFTGTRAANAAATSAAAAGAGAEGAQFPAVAANAMRDGGEAAATAEGAEGGPSSSAVSGPADIRASGLTQGSLRSESSSSSASAQGPDAAPATATAPSATGKAATGTVLGTVLGAARATRNLLGGQGAAETQNRTAAAAAAARRAALLNRRNIAAPRGALAAAAAAPTAGAGAAASAAAAAAAAGEASASSSSAAHGIAGGPNAAIGGAVLASLARRNNGKSLRNLEVRDAAARMQELQAVMAQAEEDEEIQHSISTRAPAKGPGGNAGRLESREEADENARGDDDNDDDEDENDFRGNRGGTGWKSIVSGISNVVSAATGATKANPMLSSSHAGAAKGVPSAANPASPSAAASAAANERAVAAAFGENSFVEHDDGVDSEDERKGVPGAAAGGIRISSTRSRQRAPSPGAVALADTAARVAHAVAAAQAFDAANSPGNDGSDDDENPQKVVEVKGPAGTATARSGSGDEDDDEDNEGPESLKGGKGGGVVAIDRATGEPFLEDDEDGFKAFDDEAIRATIFGAAALPPPRAASAGASNGGVGASTAAAASARGPGGRAPGIHGGGGGGGGGAGGGGGRLLSSLQQAVLGGSARSHKDASAVSPNSGATAIQTAASPATKHSNPLRATRSAGENTMATAVKAINAKGTKQHTNPVATLLSADPMLTAAVALSVSNRLVSVSQGRLPAGQDEESGGDAGDFAPSLLPSNSQFVAVRSSSRQRQGDTEGPASGVTLRKKSAGKNGNVGSATLPLRSGSGALRRGDSNSSLSTLYCASRPDTAQAAAAAAAVPLGLALAPRSAWAATAPPQEVLGAAARQLRTLSSKKSMQSLKSLSGGDVIADEALSGFADEQLRVQTARKNAATKLSEVSLQASSPVPSSLAKAGAATLSLPARERSRSPAYQRALAAAEEDNNSAASARIKALGAYASPSIRGGGTGGGMVMASSGGGGTGGKSSPVASLTSAASGTTGSSGITAVEAVHLGLHASRRRSGVTAVERSPSPAPSSSSAADDTVEVLNAAAALSALGPLASPSAIPGGAASGAGFFEGSSPASAKATNLRRASLSAGSDGASTVVVVKEEE